jgi:hypothetical protein
VLRSTAHLLIVVMLAASGRLLTCGLECLDERPASAEASCHESSLTDHSRLITVALAEVGDVMHACLPEVTEPRVIAAKPTTARVLFAASPAAVSLTFAKPAELAGATLSLPPRFGSPHPPAPSVLRI